MENLELGTTGSVFVLFEKGKKIKTWFSLQRKLNNVLHAKLLAILKTAEWGKRTGKWYSIHPDCMSASQAASKPFNVTNLIDNIKNTIRISNNNFKIRWVKVHVDIQGNKVGNELEKQTV